MDVTQITLIVSAVLSALASLVAILMAGGGLIYSFAVLRTEVGQHKNDIKFLFNHANDEGKHFNEGRFREFEKRIETEMESLKESVSELRSDVREVKDEVSSINGKLDK